MLHRPFSRLQRICCKQCVQIVSSAGNFRNLISRRIFPMIHRNEFGLRLASLLCPILHPRKMLLRQETLKTLPL